MKKLPIIGLVLGAVAALFAFRKKKSQEAAPVTESASGVEQAANTEAAAPRETTSTGDSPSA